MQFTPVIPAPPSPEGRSPVQPPVVPTFSPESTPAMPAWAGSQRAGPNYAAAYPMGQTPYLAVPGMPPGMPPGSYFMPSVALPGQALPGHMPPGPGTPMNHLRADGIFSTDWTGFPQVVNPGPSPAGTPWHPPGAFGAPPAAAVPPGAAAFNPYQQAFSYVYTPAMSMGGMPGMTPFMAPGAFPAAAGGGWPPGATPFQPAGSFGPPLGHGPAAAAAAGVAGGAAAHQGGHHRPARAADGLDRFEKFSEDNCCTSVPGVVRAVAHVMSQMARSSTLS